MDTKNNEESDTKLENKKQNDLYIETNDHRINNDMEIISNNEDNQLNKKFCPNPEIEDLKTFIEMKVEEAVKTYLENNLEDLLEKIKKVKDLKDEKQNHKNVKDSNYISNDDEKIVDTEIKIEKSFGENNKLIVDSVNIEEKIFEYNFKREDKETFLQKENFKQNIFLKNTNSNIFSKENATGERRKKESLFLTKNEVNINKDKSDNNKSVFDNFSGIKSNLNYLEIENDLGSKINMGVGETIIKDGNLIFIRDFLKCTLLNIEIKSIKFEKVEMGLLFKGKGRESTENSFKIVDRDYYLEFNKEEDLNKIYNYIEE